MTSPARPDDVFLPPAVAHALDELTVALRAGAGDNLLGLILFGGLARGRFVPGKSDINVVVVLRDASATAIAKIAEPLHEAWRTSRVDPFIIMPGEIGRLTIAFPTKILDIQRRHRLLMGEDPFVDILVDREHVRLRVEQELMNLALRLRHRFVRVSKDPVALASAANDAAAPLAVNLRALLFLKGVVSDEFQPALAIYDLAARTFGLDAEALAATKRVHESPDDATVTPELFGRLLATITKAADVATAISV
jgi:predicted nucleotidyltransferase